MFSFHPIAGTEESPLFKSFQIPLGLGAAGGLRMMASHTRRAPLNPCDPTECACGLPREGRTGTLVPEPPFDPDVVAAVMVNL